MIHDDGAECYCSSDKDKEHDGPMSKKRIFGKSEADDANAICNTKVSDTREKAGAMFTG